MLVFEELRVTNDSKNLIIAGRVRKEDYYTDVYIKNIYVNTEEDFEGGTFAPNSKSIKITLDDNLKEATISLNMLSLYTTTEGEKVYLPDLRKHLFFVFLEAVGTPSSDTPCGMDETTLLGVTMYLGDIYNSFMKYIKELGNTCTVPSGFIDMLLKYKALNLAIDSKHYDKGIEYYNEWFKEGAKTSKSSKCSCHG